MDELKLDFRGHDRDLKALREQNKTLLTHLEDVENHSRHSNLHIRRNLRYSCGLANYCYCTLSAVAALYHARKPENGPSSLGSDVLSARWPIMQYNHQVTLFSHERTPLLQKFLTSFQGYTYQLFTNLALLSI